jgi:hypothetical protein
MNEEKLEAQKSKRIKLSHSLRNNLDHFSGSSSSSTHASASNFNQLIASSSSSPPSSTSSSSTSSSASSPSSSFDAGNSNSANITSCSIERYQESDTNDNDLRKSQTKDSINVVKFNPKMHKYLSTSAKR